MSASHRSLARLPLHLFENLVDDGYCDSSLEEHCRNDKDVEQDHDTDNHPTSNDDGDVNDTLMDDFYNLGGGSASNHNQNVMTMDIDPTVELQHNDNDDDTKNNNKDGILHLTPQELRAQMCDKLGGVASTGALEGTTVMSAAAKQSQPPKQSQQHHHYPKVNTVLDLLFAPTYQLLCMLDPLLTYDECAEFQKRVAHHCCTEPTSALKLLQQQSSFDDDANQEVDADFNDNHDTQQRRHRNERHSPQRNHLLLHNYRPRQGIPTGLTELDQILLPHGGISRNSVTEIVGQAGVGKSQLAMQLCLQVVLATEMDRQSENYGDNDRDSGGGVIYVDTEGKASLERLREMARGWWKECHSQQQQESSQDWHGYFYSPTQSANAAARAALRSSDDLIDQALNQITFYDPPQSMEALIQVTLPQLEEEIYQRQQLEDDHDENGEQDDDEENDEPFLYSQRDDSGQSSPWQIQRQAAEQARKQPIRLVIIDSIAATFRRSSEQKQMQKQSQHNNSQTTQLLSVAQTLKRLADQLNVAVVVINQVGTSSSLSPSASAMSHPKNGSDNGNRENNDNRNNNTDFEDEDTDNDDSVHAALGLAWHHCVSTRICLEPMQQRQESMQAQHHQHPSEQQATTMLPHQAVRQRAITVVKSNLIATPSDSVTYTIASRGLVSLTTTAPNASVVPFLE